MHPQSNDLGGKCLLLVEDDYLVATDLALTLEDHGAEIVGPAGTVQEALELIEREGAKLTGAVLDINLRGEQSYQVAEVLSARHVPFLFVTGYDVRSIPGRFSRIIRCDKPVDAQKLARVLRSMT